MARIVSLPEAVGELAHDGMTVAIEGFSHLVPVHAGHELIRQRLRHLTIVRMVPDVVTDQLIGAGCVRKLVFGWAGNPGVGSLHRFRDAVENDWPHPLELEEHSHAGLANRFVAGASGLPFAVLRGYLGTDLLGHSANVATIECPFTRQPLVAVAAINPELSIIHAQRADRLGNVQLWGITGVQKEAVLAAKLSLVTVEEIVDELDPVPGAIILPHWIVTCIALAPGGAVPTYAQDYSVRDDDFFVRWEAISRDRDQFSQWMDENVLQPAGTEP
jgi:glutaconate CoA-transferase subunit A